MMAMRQTMLGSVATPAPVQTYSVTFFNNPSWFYDYWHVTLTLGDGTTVSDPNRTSTVSGVTALQISGDPYVDLGDSCDRWYKVVASSGGKTYFNGETASDNPFTLTLTEDITVSYGEHMAVCFSENMKVRMADGSDKPIGEVLPGDKIKAWNCVWDSDQEELVDCAVEYSTSGLARVASKYDKYTFDDGTVVEIITRDRMYCVEDNKMKWADQWHVGEHGLTYDGREVALVSHEVVEEPIVFHDLATPYHNFYVNGLLVGRKLARYPFFPSRLVHNN